MAFIPISSPDLTGLEEDYLVDAYRSGWISSSGPYIEKLEILLSENSGLSHATPVSNGTTALHLALLALGIKEGDEVIVPNLSYVAVVNAVIYCQAKPVFCDITEANLGLDIDEIQRKITSRTKAIIVVHNYGFFSDVTEIKLVAEPLGIKIIEDCAEAPFLEVNGRKVGAQGDIATYSFFGNKIVSSGEGGCVASNDAELIKVVNYLKNQANIPEKRFVFEDVGFNYRMTNLQAAVLVGQLERFNDLMDARYKVFELYQSFLQENQEVKILSPNVLRDMSPWLVSLKVSNLEIVNLREKLKSSGIDSRPFFSPHSLSKRFWTGEVFEVSEKLSGECFNLPTFPGLSTVQIRYICGVINDYFKISS